MTYFNDVTLHKLLHHVWRETVVHLKTVALRTKTLRKRYTTYFRNLAVQLKVIINNWNFYKFWSMSSANTKFFWRKKDEKSSKYDECQASVLGLHRAADFRSKDERSEATNANCYCFHQNRLSLKNNNYKCSPSCDFFSEINNRQHYEILTFVNKWANDLMR